MKTRSPAAAGVLLLISVGCGGGVTSDLPAAVEEKVAGLDQVSQGSFRAALQLQQDALLGTAATVANPDAASVEEIQRAMTVLNGAMLRVIQEVGSLRGGADGSRELMRYLRDGNLKLLEAFNKLQEFAPEFIPEFQAPEPSPGS